MNQPVDDRVQHGVDDRENLGNPGEVVEEVTVVVELPLLHGGNPLDDVQHEPGAPARREHEDDDQQHLDDLLPALVDLLGLVDGGVALLLEESSLC